MLTNKAYSTDGSVIDYLKERSEYVVSTNRNGIVLFGIKDTGSDLGELSEYVEKLYEKIYLTEHLELCLFSMGQCIFIGFRPIIDSIDLDSMLFNQSIDSSYFNEVVKVLKDNNYLDLIEIDINLFLDFISLNMLLIASSRNISMDKLHAIKFINSARYISENINKLNAKDVLKGNDHLTVFSEIYRNLIQVISREFEDQAIRYHDVATNTGLLPFVMSTTDVLNQYKGNISITASDCDESSANYHIDNAKKMIKTGREIEIKRIDLTKNIRELKEYDIVSAIDVLEHFDPNESLNVFKNIWENTKDILFIHVPFERVASPQYGHFTTFNVKKLREMSSLLENCMDLTDKYMNSSGVPLIEDGYLVLKKLGDCGS